MAVSLNEVSATDVVTSVEHLSLPRQAVLAAVGLILCVGLIGVNALALAQYQRVGSTDFLQEWTSVRNWLTNRPVYAPLHETLPHYFGPAARCVVDWNAHPPVAVVLALPFGLLPYHQAWLWWNLANLAVGATGLRLLLGRRGLGYGLVGCAWFLVLILSSNALKEQIQLGQLNGWLLLLLVGGWRGDRDDRPWISGACIGAAAAIKLFPGFVVVYFVARRDWKACVSAAATFAILSGIAAGVLGFEAYYDYVFQVLPTLGQFRTSWLNASLTGFWSKTLIGRADHMVPLLAAPQLAQAAMVVSCLALMGVVAWLASAVKTRGGRAVAYAMTTAGMLLACPITWDHYFLLLLPAIAILWNSQKAGSARRIILGVSAVILLTVRPAWVFSAAIPGHGEYAELIGLPAPVVQPWQTLTALSYLFYTALAFFGIAAFVAQRERQRPCANS